MHIDNLIKMANQIGNFFSSMPDREQAIADLASHLKRFWDPRMRKALLEYVEQEGGSELHPIVLEAVKLHTATLA